MDRKGSDSSLTMKGSRSSEGIEIKTRGGDDKKHKHDPSPSQQSYSDYDEYSIDDTLTSGTSYYEYTSETDHDKPATAPTAHSSATAAAHSPTARSSKPSSPGSPLLNRTPSLSPKTLGSTPAATAGAIPTDNKDIIIKELQAKLLASENEVQKLTKENNRLKSELAEKPSGYVDGEILDHDAPFDLRSEVNKLRITVREREDANQKLRRKAEEADERANEFRNELETIIAKVEMDEAKKAKRTTWYGAKKTYKAGHAVKHAVALQDDTNMDLEIHGKITDKLIEKEKKKAPKVHEELKNEVAKAKRVENELKAKLEALEEERLRLERERSRFEGETNILNKERYNNVDKIARLEADNQLLKDQKQAHKVESALTVSKAIHLPVPNTKGDAELDRLKISVQIQEDALRRVTVQKNQLQDALHTLETSHQSLFTQQQQIQENDDTRSLYKKVSILTLERNELREKANRYNVKADMLDTENKELRLTIKHLSDSVKVAGRRDKAVHEKQAIMLGHALAANEDLAAQVSKMKMKVVDDLMAVNGEMLALKSTHSRDPTSSYAITKTAPLPKPSRISASHGAVYGHHQHSSSYTENIPSSEHLPPPSSEHPTTVISSISTPSSSSTSVEPPPIKVELSERPAITSAAGTSPYNLDLSSMHVAREESSDAYTYEDVVIPLENPTSKHEKESGGIKVLDHGHGYLPFPLRGKTSSALATGIDQGEPHYKSSDIDTHRKYAADALRAWNGGHRTSSNVAQSSYVAPNIDGRMAPPVQYIPPAPTYITYEPPYEPPSPTIHTVKSVSKDPMSHESADARNDLLLLV